MSTTGCADEESWIADELWRMRLTLSREAFTRTIVLLLLAAQRDGRGALRPRRAVLAQEQAK